MTPEKLLQECETLTHAGRMRRMVELGQLASSNQSISETLTALARSDVYQRVLATQACYGSHDTTQIKQALFDPSRSVRSLALDLAARFCSDADLPAVLAQLTFDLQMALIRKIRQMRRQTAVDLYLTTLAERNDTTLRELLPYGSQNLVARYFARISEKLNLVSLSRMARQHPGQVVAYLREMASTRTTLDPQFVFQVNAVLPVISKKVPDLALDLAKALLTTVPLARLRLRPLTHKRPRELVDLVLAANEQSKLRFDEVAHRLDTERLLALFTRYPVTISTQCFDKLRPAQRLTLYSACERGWHDKDGALAYHIVAALPTELREREGRRHLALPALVTRPLEQFPYAAFLPWNEAHALLDTPLRSPDAELRGAALKALIGATRYQRDYLTDVLQLALQRRNEQDPVRRKMLIALAALPHSIWQSEEHLDKLAQIIQDALNATDLSYPSAQAMEKLVVHTFPFHAEWSANQLAVIYRARGQVSVYHLETYLSDAHVRSIAPALTPILQSWQKRESEGLLLAVAQALGKRLSAFDELANHLETILAKTLNSRTADSILRLFLEHRRSRAYLLIPRLLKKDKSTIMLLSVCTHLHRYRQDLLTPFLGQRAYKGRFSTGNTRIVLPLNNGFYRWTPRQQQIYARSLLDVVRAKNQNRAVREWITLIQRLAAMPALDYAPLIQLASDERPPVREAALRALGDLDAGQGIPTLLEALNDGRARIAIYALRNALLTMPQTEVLHLLHNAPLTQVTVAKEVIRLIGELSSEAAYRELLSWETRELHRDVRVALLRALWDYLGESETWEVFARAAQSPDTALARGVVHIPANSMSPLIQQRLATLTAILLAHPASEVRIATLQWRKQYPLTDYEHVLFARLLSLLRSQLPHECALAAETVFAIYTGNNAALVGEAIQEILSNRRALYTTIQHFSGALSYNKSQLLPTTRAILATLEKDHFTLSLRIDLIISGLPWEEIGPELVRIADTIHADALTIAQESIHKVYTRSPDALHLFDLEMILATHPNEHLRRLALTILITRAQRASGWSNEAIARLEQYRNDPSPLVAEAAQFTFVS